VKLSIIDPIMSYMTFARRSPLCLLALATVASTALAQAVRFERVHKPTFEVHVVKPEQPGDRAARLELGERDGRVSFAVRWPGLPRPLDVTLVGHRLSSALDEEQRVRIEAAVTWPDGRVVRAERLVTFVDEATTVFELLREADRPLTLVLEGTIELETRLPTAPVPGDPVRMLVEIQRVDAGRTISLETNLLQTFVGESVSYSFRLGDNADAGEIRLLPLRLTGDVAEIDVELHGALPRGDATTVVSRREHWVTSRGATSTLALEDGDPPTGYRFLVTPRF